MCEENSYPRVSEHDEVKVDSESGRSVQLKEFSQLVKCFVHVTSNWTEQKSTINLIKN
jgi:hypothetical protein